MSGMDNRAADTGDWEIVEAQFPGHWPAMAEQHGFVPAKVPAQLGAEVMDIRVPVRTVLYRVGTNCSLKMASSKMAIPPADCGRNSLPATVSERLERRRPDRAKSQRLDATAVDEPWRVMTFM